MRYGRYYEKFEIGAVYQHRPAWTIAGYDYVLLALLPMKSEPALYRRTIG